MYIYTIMIAPEASAAFLHPKAYRTLAEAKNVIRDEYGAPEEKTELVYKDKDYTYYYIDHLEVAN